MFAQLQLLTDRTPTAILAVPTTAVIEANGNYSGLKHSNELRESTKEAVRFE